MVSAATGIALTLTLAIVLLAGEMISDWLVELPRWVRALVLLGGVGGLGFVFWKFVISPSRKRLDDDATALLVEQTLPAFRGRFIAAIQLARESHHEKSAGLIRALLAETAAMAAKLDFRSVVKLGQLKRNGAIAGASFLIAAALFALGGHASAILLRRAFLSAEAVPRKTQVLDVTGDRSIGVGEDLNIEASAGGIVPSAGRLMMKMAAGKTQEFPLDPDPAMRAKFTRLLRNVQEPFSYSIRLNDATSPTFHVTTWPLPAVVSMECEQAFPPYTKLPPVRRPLADLRILAGSQLRLKIKANSRIKSGVAVLTGIEMKTPLQIDAKDPATLSGALSIPAKNVNGLSIQLVNEHGVASKNSAVYPIEVIADRPPTVRITYPIRSQVLVTQQGGLLIGFEASDDFGIARIILHYTADPSAPAATRSVELDPAGAGDARNVSRRFEWKIGALVPRQAVGTSLDYWIEVFDTNDLTGPGIASTEHFQVKVVTAEEKRADLANRLMNSLGTLNELDSQQRQISENLGPLIFEKQAP